MLDRTSPYYNGAKSTVKTPGQLRTFPGLVSMDLLGDFKTQTEEPGAYPPVSTINHLLESNPDLSLRDVDHLPPLTVLKAILRMLMTNETLTSSLPKPIPKRDPHKGRTFPTSLSSGAAARCQLEACRSQGRRRAIVDLGPDRDARIVSRHRFPRRSGFAGRAARRHCTHLHVVPIPRSTPVVTRSTRRHDGAEVNTR